MLTIELSKIKPLVVNGYLCRDGLGTMAIWLGKRKDIHHIKDELGKGAWEEMHGVWSTGENDWLECEIIDNFAYSSEDHKIAKTDWPKPGKCVKVKVIRTCPSNWVDPDPAIRFSRSAR